jgi:hypothetical protein
MAVRALLEIMIHLDSFRNIDLFYQGLYFVKIRLYQKTIFCKQEPHSLKNNNKQAAN